MSDPRDVPNLKIGEFAKLAGTNLRTLRYYEELGLLVPAERSTGGFRYYRPTDLNRVRMVQRLQELGLSLEVIGDLMSCRTEDGDRMAWVHKVQKALQAQEDLVAERIAALEAQRDGLRVAHGKLADCSSCTERPGEHNNFCEPCQHTGQPLPEFLSALF